MTAALGAAMRSGGQAKSSRQHDFDLGTVGTSSSSSTKSPLPITVQIPSTEAERGLLRQNSTFYVVEATAFGLPSRARRSFEDFETLHAGISRKIALLLPPLPPTYWYGNDDPETVEDRRQRLESLLQRLLLLPEALADPEEQLLRFLELHQAASVAVRFLTAPASSKTAWLKSLREVSREDGGLRPLQDPLVEGALVKLLKAAVDSDERAGNGQRTPLRPVDIRIACALLAQGLQREGRSTPVAVSDSLDSTRATAARVLLLLLNRAWKEEAPSEATGGAETAPLVAEALRTLCRSLPRTSWSKALQQVLSEGGLELLADAAEGLQNGQEEDRSEGAAATKAVQAEQLVAELLLRAFEVDVVQKFATSPDAASRKRLLNRLFMSRDAFVRVAVGLILAVLVRHGDFPEAGQASAGLRSLTEDLLTSDGSEHEESGLVKLLKEDDTWAWLCRLAVVPQSLVASFVLLVIAKLVRPSSQVIVETPGFLGHLVSNLNDTVDLEVRGPSARILLGTFSSSTAPGGEGTVPLITLQGALGAGLSQDLARSSASLGALGAALGEAQMHIDSASQLGAFVSTVRACADKLQVQADAWTSTLAESVNASDIAHRSHGEAGKTLADAESTLAAACSQHQRAVESLHEESQQRSSSADALRAELLQSEAELMEQAAVAEQDVAAQEALLDDLVQARMGLTRQLAERDEAARHWSNALRIAESSQQAELSQSCNKQLQEILVDISAAKQEASLLDEQMRLGCEELSLRRAAANSSVQRRERLAAQQASALEVWQRVAESERASTTALRTTTDRLRDTGRSLSEEQVRRRGLRGTVRELLESLKALDAQLGLLDSDDARGFVEADNHYDDH